MNLFATSQCPVQSAKDLPDIHVNKMLQETIQLLSTAHFELDGIQRGTKPTHKNHPSAIFTRACKQNYQWALAHATTLMSEYEHRRGKVHGYKKYYEQVLNLPANIPAQGDTDFPMCMPIECKKTLDVHKNYKHYLNTKYQEWATRTDKRQIQVTWTNAVKPEWVTI